MFITLTARMHGVLRHSNKDAVLILLSLAYASLLFAVNYSAFGFVMILFLILEPLGLVGIWHRLQSYFLMWPFKHRSGSGSRR